MSWRDVLGVANLAAKSVTQNPHNTQNSPPAISAYIAYSAEGDSKLLEALASACRDLPLTPAEARDALAPEDIADWHKGNMAADTLAAFARALVQRRAMDEGEVPSHYTERATCRQCGPIWLWCSAEVLGCPWCWNRAAGRPIPRPVAVRCGDCKHFRRIDHPHLGHCARGESEAIAGRWDTDRRACLRWLPLRPSAPN